MKEEKETKTLKEEFEYRESPSEKKARLARAVRSNNEFAWDPVEKRFKPFTSERVKDYYYRGIYEQGGKPFSTVKLAIDDFVDTGQIRGTDKYGKDAYFLRGSFWNPSPMWTSQGVPLPSLSEEHVGYPRGLKITVDPKLLKPETNPLYGDAGGFRNKYLKNPNTFPVLDDLLPHGEYGRYPILQPNQNAGTLSKMNPANRSGIRIVGNDGEVVYDRITPITQRPISTHARNVATEAKIIGNQKIPHAGKALGSAGAIWQMARQYQAATGQLGNSYWDREYGESDPLSLRPLYDAALEQGNFQQIINNPEWVVRNPLAAAIYGGATGGNKYSEAFADAYVPEFLKDFLNPKKK
jgi:hypothetical protein